MPFILRYTGNDTGAITFTGNTLGLSRDDQVGIPGTRDIIGAFVTTDTSMQFGSYPPGTTSDFQMDSAAAILRLPARSKVLYAELVWAGTYRVSNGTNNYFAFINKPVTMQTPRGDVVTIEPDPATAQESYRNATYNYFRSANVTSQVQAAGAGEYIVGGVVGNIDFGNSTANNCGWTLCVVYEDTKMAFRNLSLRIGIVEIAFGSDPSVSTELTGFATPVSGPLHGRMAICAQDGDANKTGDQVAFGPDEANLSVLSGPNNFVDNFFASQINGDNGELDTSGTFGDRNQINGSPGSNIVGGRQSWDITNVDISPTLANNQTSAVLQLRTVNDGYSVIAVGIYIDINSPRITVLKSVNAEAGAVGQVLTYTVVISNSGTVPANTTLLLDSLPNDTEFVQDSVLINGVPSPGSNPTTGIALGSIDPGESIVISYGARVVNAPADGVIVNNALVEFEYESVPGGPILTGDIPSNDVVTPVPQPLYQLAISKTADRTTASPGETIFYTITVVNLSEAVLTQVQVIDEQLSLFETISELAPGESATFRVAFVVPSGTFAGTELTNIASASATETERVSDTAVVVVAAIPRLAVRKTVDRTTAAPGDTVQFQITVANTGNTTLTDIQVTDPFFGFVRLIDRLQPSEFQTIPLPYLIPFDTLNGTVIGNVATAVSVETPPQQAETVVTIIGNPILSLVKSAPGQVAVDSFLTYTLLVHNRGTIPVFDVLLSDILPAGTRFEPNSVRIRQTNVPGADARLIVIGTIQPGENVRVSFAAKQLNMPVNERVANQATAQFRTVPGGPVYTVKSNVNTVEVTEEEE
ncbi:hypothetical protein [Paenibacillus sp. NPDC058071]|uniref:DUF7507 domain-containing protein n=1 Tax=Paenibacillus sp. NPDC058071 TaxID=3346326 RepID=UPI0036DB2B66